MRFVFAANTTGLLLTVGGADKHFLLYRLVLVTSYAEKIFHAAS
jgi:hypothetical protein